MDSSHQARRSAEPGTHRADQDTAEIVRLGIVLQHASNSVAAVEYLAARNVDATVIRRVLTDGARRRADHAAAAPA